jgi:hypothetical protein
LPEPRIRRTGSRVSDTRQQVLFDVRTFVPQPYKPYSFYWVLEHYGDVLMVREDFPTTARAAGGADDWCPVLMSKLLLIQRKHGWSDRETVQRATTDLQVKACLGLGIEQQGPSQATLSRRRAQLQQLDLVDRYERRFVSLLKALELLAADEPVAVDSYPVRGAGQVLDTFNLLGAAIRRALRRLAEAVGKPPEFVAERLEATEFLGRSVKGRFEVEWDDSGSRTKLLAKLVAVAKRVQEAIGELSTTGACSALESKPAVPPAEEGSESPAAPLPDPDPDAEPEGAPSNASPPTPAEATALDTSAREALAEASATLDRIVEHDVAFDDEGQVTGIVQRAAGDRLISVTDPDMRHGRKSASVLIAGFKVQVVAAVALGWILLARAFAANRHDGEDLPDLIAELDARHGLSPTSMAGDHAYGTLSNHAAFVRLAATGGPELIARMPRPANGGRFTKDEFVVDFERAELICPEAHTIPRTRWAKRSGERGWLFAFPAALCGACPMRSRCVSPKAKPRKGRTVFIVPERERLIRAHLQRRQQPGFKDRLARRVQVEHTIAAITQCGGKRVHRHRTPAVDFDVRLSCLAANLRRLGSVLRQRPEAQARLEAIAARSRHDPALRAMVLAALLLFAAYTCRCHRSRGV